MACIYDSAWRGSIRGNDAGIRMESGFRQRSHLERKSVLTVNRILVVIFVLSLLPSACTAQEGITVHNAWMRPTVQGNNGAAYFILNNHSTDSDELVEVSSDVAEAVEMHESSMAEGTGIMQMNQVFSLPLIERSEVAFEPGGLHIMLVKVNRDLSIGENIELTLHFKNHEDVAVKVSVAEFSPAGDEHSH